MSGDIIQMARNGTTLLPGESRKMAIAYDALLEKYHEAAHNLDAAVRDREEVSSQLWDCMNEREGLRARPTPGRARGGGVSEVIVTSDHLREYLRELVAISGQRQFGRLHGVSNTLLSLYLNGKIQECPPKIADILGYDRRIVYVDRVSLNDTPASALARDGGPDA